MCLRFESTLACATHTIRSSTRPHVGVCIDVSAVQTRRRTFNRPTERFFGITSVFVSYSIVERVCNEHRHSAHNPTPMTMRHSLLFVTLAGAALLAASAEEDPKKADDSACKDKATNCAVLRDLCFRPSYKSALQSTCPKTCELAKSKPSAY